MYSGAEQTRKAVFVACVYASAVFSVRKYSDPPVMPRNRKTISFFQPSHSFLSLRPRRIYSQIPAYAIRKRMKKMPSGSIPALMSIFVLTKVTPQMATTTRARI